MKRGFKVWFFSTLAYIIIKLFGWTTRVEYKNAELLDQVREKGQQPLLACWHGHQFLAYFSIKHLGVAVPVSLSDDGEIIARALDKLGYTTVRGSSSKRAAETIVTMIKHVKGGQGLAVTVDGPTGPYHEVKAGIVKVAQKTGGVIIPMALDAKRKWTLNRSWDKFHVPKPFTKVIVEFFPGITVPPKASKEDIEVCCKDVASRLEEAQSVVEGYFRPQADSEQTPPE
ncbi:lysophospholipid acyltransferase family protein [Planctomycetota bacterium]